jgi:hypothetical protein
MDRPTPTRAKKLFINTFKETEIKRREKRKENESENLNRKFLRRKRMGK